MHTAQLLSIAINTARTNGFHIREEALDGAGGGHCLIQGKKCLLLDLTQSQDDQLEDVIDALKSEPNLEIARIPRELVQSLNLPEAA